MFFFGFGRYLVLGFLVSQPGAYGGDAVPETTVAEPGHPAPGFSGPASVDALPFWDEWTALESQWKNAQPLADTYPADPSQPVVVGLLGGKIITTAFGAAILRGNKEQVETYLAAGADIKAPIWRRNQGEELPARVFPTDMAISAVAVDAAEADLLTYVLKRGADANAIVTAYARDKDGHVQCSEMTVLFNAATCDDPSILRALLEHGVADANRGAKTARGLMPPLFMATVRNNVEAVRLLLAHGADPNVNATAPGSGSKSPLTIAEELLQRQKKPADREKTEEIIRLLRQHGAQ